MHENRPIPLHTRHLGGNVERVQQTMVTEFYATTTIHSHSLKEDLEDLEDLGAWMLDYNYWRVHGSLGKTPMQRSAEALK